MITTPRMDNIDQTQEVGRLNVWLARVSRRSPRIALCRGLFQLIERDRLRYGVWLSTLGPRRAFAVVRNSDDMEDIIESAYPDREAGGLLIALIKGHVAFETGYSKGLPDLIFMPLAQEFGLIHIKEVTGKPI
jgi:hypothetical protein